MLVKILFHEFLSCVKDYIEHMATFTVLVKIYSIEYFYNTEVPGFGETFVQQKVSPRIMVLFKHFETNCLLAIAIWS